MSLQSQLSNYVPVGEVAVNLSRFVQWINDSISILSMVIPEEQASRYWIKTAVPSPDGLPISGNRFFRASKGGRLAGLSISETGELNGITGYDGLYKASELFPIAYISGGKLYVLPGGGHAWVLGVPSVATLSEASITNLPDALTPAAIYYAVIQYWLRELAMLIDEFVGPDDIPALPAVPVLPSLSLDADNATLVLTVFPAAPADPAITAGNAAASSMSSPTVSNPALGSNPIYTKVAFNADFTDADARAAADDIEMLNGELSKIQLQLSQFGSKMTDEMNRIQTFLTEYQGKIQHSLAQGQLTIQGASQNAQLETDVDKFNKGQALQAAVAQYQNILGKYSTTVQAVSSENQSKVAEFQARVQAVISRNQMKVSAYSAEVGALLQEYSTTVGAVVNIYNAELQGVAVTNEAVKYRAEMLMGTIGLMRQQYQEVVSLYIASVQPAKKQTLPDSEAANYA